MEAAPQVLQDLRELQDHQDMAFKDPPDRRERWVTPAKQVVVLEVDLLERLEPRVTRETPELAYKGQQEDQEIKECREDKDKRETRVCQAPLDFQVVQEMEWDQWEHLDVLEDLEERGRREIEVTKADPEVQVPQVVSVPLVVLELLDSRELPVEPDFQDPLDTLELLDQLERLVGEECLEGLEELDLEEDKGSPEVQDL